MSAMRVEAEAAARLDLEDAIQIAWRLPDSALGYVLIALPLEDGGSDDSFFGHSHYVEVQDQVFGEYGGLERLALLSEREVMLRFRHFLPEAGDELTIRTPFPMGEDVLDRLRRAERLIGG